MKNLILTSLTLTFSLFAFADNVLPKNYPGKDIIGKGYNVFGEFANNKSIQPYPLFDFSKMARGQSQGYLVPKRVFLKEVNEHIIETVEGASVNEYITNLSQDVGLDIDAFIFQASFEDNFNVATASTSGVFYYTYMDLNTKWQVSLDSRNLDTLKNYLDAQFKADLAKMDPASLFSEYGTHFISSAYIGGRIDYSSTTLTNEESVITEVRSAISGKYKALSGELSNDELYDDKLKEYNTNTRLSVVGGASEFTRNIESHEQYEDWAVSLNSKPALCGFDNRSLKPIWLLCATAERAKELEDYFNNIVLPKHPLPIYHQRDEVLDNKSIVQEYSVYLEAFKIIYDCDYPTLLNSDGSGEFKYYLKVYVDDELVGTLSSPEGKVYSANSGEFLNINQHIKFKLDLVNNKEIKVKYMLKEIGTLEDQVLGNSTVVFKQPFNHNTLCNFEKGKNHYTAYRLTHTSGVCDAEIYMKIAPANDPESVEFGNTGWGYFEAGDYEKCLEFSKKAIKLDPGLWFVQYNVGLVYLINGNPLAYEKYEMVTRHCENPETIKFAYQDIIDFEKKNGEIKESEQIKILLKSNF